ncbi:MAG: hypothetical protein QOD66_3387, partial [Solirubrobacteraceae bacterium]|nr:hypothetical protein [Solirubrobacteraceae bacterium]
MRFGRRLFGDDSLSVSGGLGLDGPDAREPRPQREA